MDDLKLAVVGGFSVLIAFILLIFSIISFYKWSELTSTLLIIGMLVFVGIAVIVFYIDKKRLKKMPYTTNY